MMTVLKKHLKLCVVQNHFCTHGNKRWKSEGPFHLEHQDYLLKSLDLLEP